MSAIGWLRSLLRSSPVPDFTIHRAQLQPGDIVVLKSPYSFRPEQYDSLREHLSNLFPGHRIAVLEHGMDIQIVSPLASEKPGEHKSDDGQVDA